MEPPPLVTLHVWRVPRRAVGGALVRMARDPRRLRALPGVRFGKLLGTGTGTGFGPGDADLTRYAAVVAWDDPAGGDLGPVGAAWAALGGDTARIDLTPLSSRGRWSGTTPFGDRIPRRTAPAGPARGRAPAETPLAETPSAGPAPVGTPAAGPAYGDQAGAVLALTRARLRPSRVLTFWRAVPPVARELAAAPGLLARFGVGEAPIGWQGTVSLWRGAADLTRFAYRQPEHRAVIARTPLARWYAEELFARFAVRDISGDKAVLGWREGAR
jgi:hypothetical protein